MQHSWGYVSWHDPMKNNIYHMNEFKVIFSNINRIEYLHVIG